MVSKSEESEGKATSSNPHTPASANVNNYSIKNGTQTSSTSSESNQNTVDSTSCLITSSNVHISNMYVYNFTPDVRRESPSFSPHLQVPKYQSPAASSGPTCRICHEGDGKEDLVSPCRCTGTLGLVHKSCMERWLSMRCGANDKCEICHYKFATVRSPKSVFEWLRSNESNDIERRSLLGDVTCFFLLTPLALISTFLCIEGTKRQVLSGNSLEAGCLMAMATFLITMYFVWNAFTLRYHLNKYLKWRAKNYNVKLVRVQRVSTRSEESHCVQVIPQVSNQNLHSEIVVTISDVSPEMQIHNNSANV